MSFRNTPLAVVHDVDKSTLLTPELLSIVVLEPKNMSARDLGQFVDYLDDNGLDTLEYRYAFWGRFMTPLATLVMLFISLFWPANICNTMAVGFALFRLFDIVKPWPCRRLEKLPREVKGDKTLQPVLDTLRYLKHETGVWLELTTLLIPGENDSEAELHAMTQWVVENLGPDVPMHFSAFHPDWKMRDVPKTPASTLDRARRIAMDNGVHYAFTGNVHDSKGGSTYCPGCKALVIERDWYELGMWRLDADGACSSCGTRIAGHFDTAPGGFGARRIPVRLAM